MIKQIDMTGDGVELRDDLKKYITKKIGKLSKYMPRHARETAYAEVKIRSSEARGGAKYTCEVILQVPGEQLTAAESTLNMFAAVDIVETKLKNQLRRYKQQQLKERRMPRGQLMNRLQKAINSRKKSDIQ
jgi:putative sigma-54 modulation protein